jgi:hypothetical protein
MPAIVWKVLADLTVAAHVAYVSFVVLGQFLILIGALRGWSWIRNRAFRFLHLAMILIVVLEAWVGMTCPLTVWERAFRERAGLVAYQGDFIARWLHDLLFFDAPPVVFTVCYSLFGVLVLVTLLWAPPRMRTARNEDGAPSGRG